MLRKNFLAAHSGSEQIEHVTHPETKPANAGAATALAGFGRDAREKTTHVWDHSGQPENPIERAPTPSAIQNCLSSLSM